MSETSLTKSTYAGELTQGKPQNPIRDAAVMGNVFAAYFSCQGAFPQHLTVSPQKIFKVARENMNDSIVNGL
jgi:hypothetical protein